MGEMLLNGRLYGASGIRELTQAQYDALPESKLTDGILYCIKDTGIVEGEKYSPVIYSLEEREIGVWTNGKPLYQKTIPVTLSGSSNTVSQSHGVTNIERVVNYFGSLFDTNVSRFVPQIYYSNIENYVVSLYYVDSTVCYIVYGNWLKNNYSSFSLYVTIQYTKTTDIPGSGTWGTDGVPTVHYDGNERIIGTWFGETLYEKTYHYTGTLNSNTWVTIDSSRLPSNTPYFSVMNVCFISTELSSSAKFSAYKPSIPFDITISTNEQLYFENKSNYKIYEFAFTIQYTKTS